MNEYKADIKACVWTTEGYKEIVSVKYNKDLNLIELELEDS